MYIAIAGNIGSGKTTLTKMLAKHYGWKKFLEPVADNPYIDDYYKDIPRWALNYLEGINNLYEDFIMNKYTGNVLIVEVDNLDFEHNPKQFGDIIDKIDAKLFGLFSER